MYDIRIRLDTLESYPYKGDSKTASDYLLEWQVFFFFFFPPEVMTRSQNTMTMANIAVSLGENIQLSIVHLADYRVVNSVTTCAAWLLTSAMPWGFARSLKGVLATFDSQPSWPDDLIPLHF